MVQMYGSHDFHFLHKPIVYGVAHLLYGVALSDSVIKVRRDKNIVVSLNILSQQGKIISTKIDL